MGAMKLLFTKRCEGAKQTVSRQHKDKPKKEISLPSIINELFKK